MVGWLAGWMDGWMDAFPYTVSNPVSMSRSTFKPYQNPHGPIHPNRSVNGFGLRGLSVWHRCLGCVQSFRSGMVIPS